MRNEIGKVISNKDVIRIAKEICKYNIVYKDILQDAAVMLLGLPEEKYLNILSNNKLEAYVIKYILNQYYDKSKRYKKKYFVQPINKQELIDSSSSSSTSEGDSFMLNYCLELFDKVSPSLIKLSKELRKMEVEATKRGRFPLDKELVFLYNKYGSLRKVEDEVGVSMKRVHIAIQKLKSRINENRDSK